jgi:hypothetical protein
MQMKTIATINHTQKGATPSELVELVVSSLVFVLVVAFNMMVLIG